MFGRKRENSEMGQAMAAGLAQSENRPQSSQDALDQALGIGPYLLYDEDIQRLIRSMALTKKGNKTFADPRFVAIAIQSGYLARASKLDPIDIEIALREAAVIARRVKMKMSEAEYEAGGALVVDAIFNGVIVPNYLSAKDGFIAKMTKVSPKSMEVTYREDRRKNVGGFMG